MLQIISRYCDTTVTCHVTDASCGARVQIPQCAHGNLHFMLQQPLTLTAKVFSFLQLEVPVLTGVARKPAGVWFAVALPTFLDKTHKTMAEPGSRCTHRLM